MDTSRKWLLLLLCLILVACAIPSPSSISGTVVGEDGAPLPGATVRIQTTPLVTSTNEKGEFILQDVPGAGMIRLTAFSPGYFIVEADAEAGDSKVVIELHPHSAEDHPDYIWLSAGEAIEEGPENTGCAECHATDHSELAAGSMLPYDDWLADAHSQSATNVRFLTIYTGTDVAGNQSPLTSKGYSRDYGPFPLPPNLSQPYYGPGYQLDFPDSAGNCAACHLPVAAANTPYGIDPTKVEGVGAEGVTCDFCHKVWDVKLNPTTGLPYPNMPGVLSFELRRPPEGHQFFAGPYDDVAPGEDTFSPLQQESAFCAPCHFGVFWDVPVYNSYGEWLDSPYSDPETGQTCQNCHMPSSGVDHFAHSEKGGLERDPATIFSHRMPGASDEVLLQNAVTMEVNAERTNDQLAVTVVITNDQTGHHVPTDSPLRHLILLVSATDITGAPLTHLSGSIVPDWGGVGDPAEGYYAGLPGTAYAKVLQEFWTEISPTGAYWNPTRVLMDNRIPAMGDDATTYSFAAPNSGKVDITVTLLFRRAFIELMDQKGWNAPDIVMAHQSFALAEDD